MSHFVVLVVGGDVDKQMASYHQFECTGHVDEFVQNVDELPEARQTYEEGQVDRLKAPDGSLHEPWDDQFYRDPAPEEQEKLGYRSKVRFIPEGYKEVKVSRTEVETFQEFIKDYYDRPLLPEGEEPDLHGDHKFGWYRVNAEGEVTELIDRTNPNYKWDWYQIGGRWSGFLKLKEGAQGKLGSPGVMGSRSNDGPGYADQARKGDINFEGMRNEAGEKAGAKYDQFREAVGDLTWKPWETVFEEHPNDINAARTVYHEQAAIKALRKHPDLRWENPDVFQCSREEFVQRARDKACATFALVKDGKWHEKGEMGWFATVTNEMDPGLWLRKFNEILDDLPEDTLLTVVDCHI